MHSTYRVTVWAQLTHVFYFQKNAHGLNFVICSDIVQLDFYPNVWLLHCHYNNPYSAREVSLWSYVKHSYDYTKYWLDKQSTLKRKLSSYANSCVKLHLHNHHTSMFAVLWRTI